MVPEGQAYLAAGEQTAKVELVMRRVATAHGVRRSLVVAGGRVPDPDFHERASGRGGNG